MTADEASKVVDFYAQLIRDEYCRVRNRWHMEHEMKHTNWGARPIPKYDGGEDVHGRQHQNIWRKIAVFVIKHNLNPTRYVQAQFNIRVSKPIEPTQLLTEYSLSLYEAQESISEKEIARLFEMQKEQVLVECDKLRPCRARGWSDKDITRAVLGNQLIPLSALFRYCIAKKEGYDDLAEEYKVEALTQYLAYPDAYDRIWGEWIPSDFRSEARQLTDYVTVSEAARSRLEQFQPCQRAIIMD